MTKYCQRIEIQITESLLPKSQIAKMVKRWRSHLKNLHRRCPGWGGVVGQCHVMKVSAAGDVDFGEEKAQEDIVSMK